MLLEHGGNIKKIIATHKLSQNKLIDFSSNINPLGGIPKITNIINSRLKVIDSYPEPECKLGREAIAGYLCVNKDNILIGNGSNELIHLIPRAIGCSSALIYQPAFSEYALSLKLANAKPYFIFAKEDNGFAIDIEKIRKYARKVKLIILCNPNNPTGYLLKKRELLDLLSVCAKNKTYLLLDEVFMEFAEDEDNFSLVKEAVKYKYLLVLRSLTKFFSLPGLRIGYLVADKKLIKHLNRYQPTWSVNSLAQEVIPYCLTNRRFIKKSKEYIERERNFLFAELKKIKLLYPYLPSANFIFCKILDKKLNSGYIFKHLIKWGIVIRDCSNFAGLNNRFFRVAVRKRKDNLYLVSCLRRICG